LGQRRHGQYSFYESLITALSIGGFFIILGLVVVTTPNFVGQTVSFFQDFTTIPYPMGGTSELRLPIPSDPAAYIDLYTAALNFAIGIAILQAIILALRIALRSRVGKISETIGDLVFWAGVAWAASAFLLAGTVAGWFQYWSILIFFAGLGLIARFIVYLVARLLRRPAELYR
jgi:hypothetical protein